MICCNGLQNLIDCAGQRGLSVIVYTHGTEIGFLLQSRGVNFDERNHLEEIAGFSHYNLLLNLVSDVGFRFCPFCGKELQIFAKTSRTNFDNLAKQHKRFLEQSDDTK